MKITKVRVLSILLIIFLCFVISYFYILSHNTFGRIYQEETRNTVIEIKKTFLKDTIDNIFAEINIDKEQEQKRYENIVYQRFTVLNYFLEDDASFRAYFINLFDADIKHFAKDNFWSVVAWDNKTNKVIYDPLSEVDKDVLVYLEDIKPQLQSYKLVNRGNFSAIFGIKSSYINESIKNITAEKIRRQKFNNGAYIWVNEIVNYEGGYNYAIRRVHSNLPDTEGSYLNTFDTDIKGNKPYLEELNGVKKDGEIFFAYYFKKANSDEISEKISYAKLYKDFDWVIATGVQIDEIDKYVDNTNTKTQFEAKNIMLKLILIMLLILSLVITLVLYIEGRYSKKVNRGLKNEADIDNLTNAYSRSRGKKELEAAFKGYLKGKEDPGIMMFDLDKFKLINDTYGHDIGDKVLIRAIDAINEIVRDADIIIRWGGDEFIGIFHGLKRDNATKIAKKILDSVNAVRLPVKLCDIDEVVTIEMSIGITYFSKEDKHALDAIKRADTAMYNSKEKGRNTVSFLGHN